MKQATSKTIDGVTDLVVIAPIREGMIDAFENITYESRLKFVAEALHKIRVNAREHETVAPFADTAERILSLFNFRIGVLDRDVAAVTPGSTADSAPDVKPQRFMFLVATFDGPFEPYMRLIWKPLGPFLDLLLCNCEGYKLATQTGFPEYIDWVRRHQVEPSIFYSTSGLTLRDQFYLAQLEKLQRELDPAGAQPTADQQLAALTVQNPEAKALEVWRDPVQAKEAIRLSFEALAVLYRLADYFPPDRGEAAILLQAAQDLLLGLPERVREQLAGPNAAMLIAYGINPQQKLGPYTEQWLWFSRPVPPPLPQPDPALDRTQVQKGLLSSYDEGKVQVTNGMVVLLRIDNPALARLILPTLLAPSWEDDSVALQPDWTGDWWRIYRNLSFTFSGLTRLGVEADALDRMPREFRDGLHERAPLLGDVRAHHPRRWTLPPRYDAKVQGDDASRPAINSEEIDVVLQLRLPRNLAEKDTAPIAFQDYEAGIAAVWESLAEKGLLDAFTGLLTAPASKLMGAMEGGAAAPGFALPTEIAAFFENQDPLQVWAFLLAQMAEVTGLRVLSVQSCFRPLDDLAQSAGGGRYNRDHFGFLDGISQPEPAANWQPQAPDAPYDNRVPFGDVLVGYGNSRGDRAQDHAWQGGFDYQQDGSFLVLRKIAQYPQRLHALEAQDSTCAAALVGRTRDGVPLVPGHDVEDNSFTYRSDGAQTGCPFSAHIRLANPRDEFQKRPAPRILRRGMSYGHRLMPGDAASADAPRGVLFMAYNASLAEQYEVVQRWLNGGNATGVASAANDPLTGAAQEPGGRTFRYRQADGTVQRVRIDQPLSELLWGLYAFAPSRRALMKLCLPQAATSKLPAPQDDGAAIIARILALPHDRQRQEWKRLLEDFAVKDTADLAEAPRVWRAIREAHGGALRIEAGMAYDQHGPADPNLTPQETPVVLVGDWPLIKAVLANPAGFSVSQQTYRTQQSFGAIYVSMDPDPADTPACPVSRYAREALETNRIVLEKSQDRTFQQAAFAEAQRLAAFHLQRARGFNAAIGIDSFFKVELRRDFLTPVLAGLCTWLFDIPRADFAYFDAGPWGWRPIDPQGQTTVSDPAKLRKPRCPADFMAPSRFSFYPRPSQAIQDYGRRHGAGLGKASQNMIPAMQQAQAFTGQLSAEMAKVIADPELLARNIIGNMEGMLPPTDGIMRGIFYDWIDRDELWRHQSRYLEERGDGPANLGSTEAAIDHAVRTAMCKRPAPDLLYRTATCDGQVGNVAVKAGETVILGLVSPMLASLDGDAPDVEAVFGGYRTAALQPPGEPTHSCPAYGLVMAMVHGMIAGLFDAGRITVQPASLILRFSDFPAPPPGQTKGLLPQDADYEGFV